MDQLTMKRFAAAFVLCLFLAVTARVALSDPSGSTISNNSTESGPTTSPSNHTAPRSTITTMILTAVQQDQHWKAYVGNVTGSLTLDDADGYTIYDWDLTGMTITGEVYAARTTLDFSTVGCALTTTVTSENTFHNMTQGGPDTINATFNATGHRSFVVAGTTIPADNCSSTALFVSDTRQVQSSTATFQELLLQDNAGSLVFTSLINDNKVGFDGQTYDFQMLVPESDVKPAPTTYYFYVELGG